MVETGLAARALGWIASLVGKVRKRKSAERWVGEWEAYELVGRNLVGPMKGAGPATVSLPKWELSAKPLVACYDCDATGRPTRQQVGHLLLDPENPDAARRVGRYTDSVEFYEQELRMIDKDTIIILPVPAHSTLGDVYGKHGWRRKR